MDHFVPAIAAIFLLVACNSDKRFDHRYFEIGERSGPINDSKINEASGLAASVTNRGMLWTHNDSGDKARIFLIDVNGNTRAIVELKGVSNRDWEDIAVGPGPVQGKSYVYIGEIGDNFARYEYKYVYRIEEPALEPKAMDLDTVITQVDSIKFKLPGGPRDTEALIVDPVTKDIYIFSKNENQEIRVYRLPYPQSTTSILTADQVLTLPILKVNGADISADGTELLIKNYVNVFYWKRQAGESLIEMLKHSPVSLPYVTEPQGEAIAFDREGRGYFTLSEENDHKKPYLMFYKRKKN